MTNLGMENADGSVEEHLEWEEWMDRYDPVMVEDTRFQDDGILLELDVHQDVIAYIKERLPHIAEDDIPRHVWTITSGDGWNYTSTGFHFVDRESYLICRVPWKRENEACMYNDWGTWCDHCDAYVKECDHEE